MIIATLNQAKLISGGVSKGNKKMHGSTYSTDPLQCHVGKKLVKVEGSTCSGCYALKLQRVYPSASKAWINNLDIYKTHEKNGTLETWATGLIKQINKISANKEKKQELGAGFHRWFAAGDLYSVDMLRAIVYIANKTQNIKHWLPTREKAIVSKYLASNPQGFPFNLVVRVSSAMVDGAPIRNHGLTSTVHHKGAPVGYECPAYKTGGDCGSCSACWSHTVKNVSYKKH